jgi:molecular chaperone GrpE
VTIENSNTNVEELHHDRPVEDTAGEAAGKADEKPVENPLTAEVAALTAERDQLLKTRAELHDRSLRLQAEFDNFRKRTEKDRSEFAQYAGMELIRELLPVLDNFELALKTECASKDYAKGVEMIYQRMAENLKKAGLEPIEALGKPFDPHFHQAVEKFSTGEAPEDTVLSEFQRGYLFKGKLLRASMVKVAVKP